MQFPFQFSRVGCPPVLFAYIKILFVYIIFSKCISKKKKKVSIVCDKSKFSKQMEYKLYVLLSPQWPNLKKKKLKS